MATFLPKQQVAKRGMADNIGIGNEINGILRNSKTLLYAQGELAQLTHTAFIQITEQIKGSDKEEITVDVPIGYRPDKVPMTSPHTYKKQELLERYSFLTFTQIPINGIYQLVIIIEATLGDLVRKVVARYPNKLSTKRQISTQKVLEANSIEELHVTAIDSLLNDLSYKSPREFASELESILSINVVECPAYHHYIEMKATRDILIHNQGIANETYVAKAGSHARVPAGGRLPTTQSYFLEVYEECLRLVEWLESKLHDKWHSSEYEQEQAAKASKKSKG